MGDQEVETKLPNSLVQDEPDYVPKWVVHDRWVWPGGDRVRKLLIQLDKATWVDEAEIVMQYPDFHLEDKAIWKEGGVVMDCVYTRRAC